MVDLVLVQADSPNQVDLDLVAGRQTTNQVSTVTAGVLSDGEDRRDVVSGVRVLGGEERVVEIEFTNRDTVGPGGPFRRERTGGYRTRWSPAYTDATVLAPAHSPRDGAPGKLRQLPRCR